MSGIGWTVLAFAAALLAASGISPASARAPAASPAPATPPAAPPAPTKSATSSIPIPEVARQAEEVARQIREFDALAVPTQASVTAEQRLPEIAERILTQISETDRILGSDPGATTLEGLTVQWQSIRGELVGYVNGLARHATASEEAIARLTSLRDSWTQTKTDARTSRAPAPVIERIDSVVAALEASRVRLLEYRGSILVLQDRIARQVAQCETMLERVALARQGATGRLLQPDSVQFWRREQVASAMADLPGRVRDATIAGRAQLAQFLRDQRSEILVHVALLLILTLLIQAARRSAKRLIPPGDPSQDRVLVLDRSVSAATVLTILMSIWIYSPPLPRVAVGLVQLVVLWPALRIIRLLVDPALVPRVRVMGCFFLADIVRHSASVVPVLEQQIFLLEMVAGIAVLSWRMWTWRRARAAGVLLPWATPGVRGLSALVLVAFAAATVAAAAGYMRLALLFGAGILGNGYLAVVLYAAVRVADGLVACSLRGWPLSHLAMVRRYRPLLERRARILLRSVAAGVWVVFSLRYFGLWNAAVDAVVAALGATLKRGSVSISLGDVVVFALTVAGAFVLSRLLRFFLAEEVYPRLSIGRGLPEALSGVMHYTLLLAGFLLGLAVLGVDLTKITILAGAFGVGIGFGLQNVVNNFVSGAIVLFERKVNVGDAVRIADVEGQVQQMGMRACVVRAWDGSEVIVPNANLTTERVVNWTLSDRRRRVDVAVGVAYGTAPEKALEILLAVARAHTRVLEFPEPVALFRGFGESALNVELRCWTDRFDLSVQTHSELAVAVYAALREAGIEIPFPQREVRLRQE